MKIDEKVSAGIYNEIIIDLVADYKQKLEDQSSFKSEYGFIREFYQSLDVEKKKLFTLFLDSLARDISDLNMFVCVAFTYDK